MRICDFVIMYAVPGLFCVGRKQDGSESMRAMKKINNSAVLALDSAGREVVVLGKGVGSPQVPYEITALTKIERTFYDFVEQGTVG